MRVKINPLIAVLTILAIAMVVSTLTARVSDCAYTPDGQFRVDAIGEWMTDPGYTDNDYDFMPNCDVWAGIEVSKPLGTMELNWETEANAPIIGRMNADNSGFVAVVRLDRAAEFRALNETETFISVGDLAKIARVFRIPSTEKQAIVSARSSLSPMRDFQGDIEVTLGPITEEELGDTAREMRAAFELDSSKTRFLKCRRPVQVNHWSGVLLTFGSEESGGKPRYFWNRECVDVAFAGMRIREQKTKELLLQAAGAEEFIKMETAEKYPQCGPADWDRCFQSHF